MSSVREHDARQGAEIIWARGVRWPSAGALDLASCLAAVGPPEEADAASERLKPCWKWRHQVMQAAEWVLLSEEGRRQWRALILADSPNRLATHPAAYPDHDVCRQTPNPFLILGVGPDATEKEVHRAMARGANRWHPDKLMLAVRDPVLFLRSFEEVLWPHADWLRTQRAVCRLAVPPPREALVRSHGWGMARPLPTLTPSSPTASSTTRRPRGPSPSSRP